MRIGEKIVSRRLTMILACVAMVARFGHTAEMKLFNGQRVTVLLDGYSGNSLTICLTSGDKKSLSLTNAAAIYFSGRSDYFIRTGDQKFILNAGGHICAAVEEFQNGDTLIMRSQSLGRISMPAKFLHGFTALAVEGRAARLADDLMRPEGLPPGAEHAYMDHVIDRRGVPYAGVVEKFSSDRFEFEHDETLQRVRLDTFKLAGVRMAEAAKEKGSVFNPVDELGVGVRCRDGSYVVGKMVGITPFQWTVLPSFDETRKLVIPSSEITRVDVLGGRTVFLALLTPVKAEESTTIAPPQPFQNNSNSQGEPMDIGGFVYHGGVGVHARSKITYKIDGKFRWFYADVGIDGRLEKSGSVIFRVVGDGKELHKTPVIRGRTDKGGTGVAVPIGGVKMLTLEVDPTADLDQADLANWGAARLVR